MILGTDRIGSRRDLAQRRQGAKINPGGRDQPSDAVLDARRTEVDEKAEYTGAVGSTDLSSTITRPMTKPLTSRSALNPTSNRRSPY